MEIMHKGMWTGRRVLYLSVDAIRANPDQPRKYFEPEALRELAESIGRYGILQPLTVRRGEDGYELIAGERRLRAAKLAGLREVPCLAVRSDEEESALLSLIENLQRQDLHYMEEAAAMRSSHVVYDRADSAFDTLQPGMIDWDGIFRGASWFHWSGISAAVSAGTAAVCAEAIAAAHAAGLTVSCDINYRKNLWKYGKEPQEVLPPLMEQCDAFFGTDDEYEKVLGMQLPQFAARDAAYRPDTAGYERASAEVAARFPRCRSIVFGLRSVLSANHHLISGTLYTGGRLHSTRVYDIDPVVDCVGVGDAFVGGLLYGMAAHPHDAQFALDFGTAACALKNTVPGDYNQFTAAEVEQLARGSVSGRIAR